MSLLPAALFALIFGLFATLHLAKTPGELRLGLFGAAALALCVWLVSPLFLVALGSVAVAGGLTRANKTLGKRARKKKKNDDANPATETISQKVREGFAESLQTPKAQEIMTLFPDVSTTPAQALMRDARAVNPFRPEGSGGRVLPAEFAQKK